MAMPQIAARVMEDKDGRNPTFFAKKILTVSDTNRRQNRLLFHEDDVTSNILPLLSEMERETVMSEPEGLPVELYTINGWRYEVFLRRRQYKGFVLKGTQWRNAVVLGELRVGDHVQLWSFRKLDDTLCLVIVKI